MPTHTVMGMALAAIVAVSAITVSEASAQIQIGNSGISVPVTGAGPGAAFTGTLVIQRFARTANQVVAVGIVNGVVTDTTTGVASNVIRQVRVPLDTSGGGEVSVAAVCSVLSLVLGPLNLDLLGLVVDLNQVVLNIDAVSGAGNLLGNLLCAITGLLDGTPPLGLLTTLLNQVLAILG
jgi:hypothetical protein